MWVKIDDAMPDNPKLEELSDGAFRLYISALCHAQRFLTDGHIPSNRVARLTPRFKPTYVTELLDRELWERNGNGYLIHDFTHYNKDRAHWETKRAADAKRLADWRANNKGDTHDR